MVDDDDLRFGDRGAEGPNVNPGGLVGEIIEWMVGILILIVFAYVIWNFIKTLYLTGGIIF